MAVEHLIMGIGEYGYRKKGVTKVMLPLVMIFVLCLTRKMNIDISFRGM